MQIMFNNNDAVTHPHVRDRALCAGDAATPIAEALAAGRLADAFLLVRSVLRHYNVASPYVALDHWNGQPCAECGATSDADETYFCEGCDSDVCDECIGCCSSCSRSRCGGCLNPCAVCHQNNCSGCLEDTEESQRSCCPDCRVDCSACGKTVAADELAEGTALCPDCDSAPEPDTVSGNDPVPLPPSNPQEIEYALPDDVAHADAGLQPSGVVETAVLLPSG